MAVKMAGDRVSLATVCIEDAEKWAEWLSDLDVALPLGDEAYVPMPTARVKQDIERMATDGHHVFSVVENGSGKGIGRCMLFNVDFVNRSCMVGIFIGDKAFWNNHYGRESMVLLLDYAFSLLNLNSVMLGVFSFNERAISCYKAVGFREIGRRREARIVGGVKYDGVLMDMLAEEFRQRYTSKVMPGMDSCQARQLG